MYINLDQHGKPNWLHPIGRLDSVGVVEYYRDRWLDDMKARRAETMAKYPVRDAFNPDQPRDDHGRWTSTGQELPSNEPVASHGEQAQGIQGLRDYLEMVSKIGGDRPTPASFIKEHGRGYFADDQTFAGPKGEQKMCYQNAGRNALQDDSLTYVEGYVSLMGIPIEHAWNVTQDGRVIDPTIRDPKNILGYFGVPFKTEYLSKSVHTNGYWGLLGFNSLKTMKPLIDGVTPKTSFLADAIRVRGSGGKWDESKHPRDDKGKWTSTIATLDLYKNNVLNPFNDREFIWAWQHGKGDDQKIAVMEFGLPTDEHTMYLKHISAVPQRAGAGRLAMEKLLEYAQEKKLDVTLMVARNSETPHRVLYKFYKSLGFVGLNGPKDKDNMIWRHKQ